jgi:hypothetical protein
LTGALLKMCIANSAIVLHHRRGAPARRELAAYLRLLGLDAPIEPRRLDETPPFVGE